MESASSTMDFTRFEGPSRQRSRSPPRRSEQALELFDKSSKSCIRVPQFRSPKTANNSIVLLPKQRFIEERQSLLASSSSVGWQSVNRDRIEREENEVTATFPVKLPLTASAPTTPSTTDATIKSSLSPASLLLTMPAPQDRSHKKRLELERSGNKIANTYDGEQEPAGYRGQISLEQPNINVSPHLQLDISNGGIQGTTPTMRKDFDTSTTPTSIRILTDEVEYNVSTQSTLDSPLQNIIRSTEARGRYEGELHPPFGSQTATSRRPKPQYEGEMAPPDDFDPKRRNNNESIHYALSDQRSPSEQSLLPGNQPPYLRQHSQAVDPDQTQHSIARHQRNQSMGIEPFASDQAKIPADPSGNRVQTHSLRADERRLRQVIEPPAVVLRSTSINVPTNLRKRYPTRIDEIGAHLREMEVSQRKPIQIEPVSALSPLSSSRQVRSTKEPRKIRLRRSVPPGRDTSVTSEEDSCFMGSDLVPLSPRQFYRDDGESSSTHSDEVLRAMMPELVKDIVRSDSHMRDTRSAPTASNESNASLLNLEAVNASAKQHIETGEFELALSLFSQVLSIYTKKYGQVHPLVASVYHNLGMVHSQLAEQRKGMQQQRDRQQSLECFQAAARSARDSLGKNHPNVAVSLVRVGFLLLQAQHYKNALITFSEALRIRLEHYGDTPHGLVANLYNNLGICHLHLKQFDESQKCLNQALEIQRQVLEMERVGCSREDLRTRLLEVADTLCNVGGLALEKLQNQPGIPKHATDGEHAFAEALEIRSTVLGSTHPLVLQIQNLLGRVRSVTPVLNTETIPVGGSQFSKSSRPLSPMSEAPAIPEFETKLGTTLSPLSTMPSTTPRLSGSTKDFRQMAAPIAESDKGVEVTTPGRKGDQRPISPPISPLTPTSREVLLSSSSSSPVASRALVFSPLDPPSPRHPYRGFGTQASSGDRSKPIDAPEESRARYISGAVSPPGFLISCDSIEATKGGPGDTAGSPISKGSLTAFLDELPPIKEIVVDKASGRTDSDRFESKLSKTTVWVSPHPIPTQSPLRRPIQLDDTSLDDGLPCDVIRTGSESSLDYHRANERELYAEESCLLSALRLNSGNAITQLIDSYNEDDVEETMRNLSKHEIVVVRPYGPSETEQSQRDTLERSLPASAVSWCQASPSDAAHKRVASAKCSYYDSPALKLKADDATFVGAGTAAFDENDDGIAPLFARHRQKKPDPKTVLSKSMLEEPEFHLFEIHAIASRYMRKGRLPEALHLFLLILDVQRKTNGELHEDVGAAIHNVGLTQLRMDRHELARESFARAVRIRKGALGEDHPEVAVSQVKVGIALLLLHNFDEALVAFRDALTTRKRALGALHPSLARVYNNIGCVHVEFKELRDARRAFEAALDIQRNALCHEPTSGPLMFGAATTLCNLGYLYRHRAMPEKAVLVLKEALIVSTI